VTDRPAKSAGLRTDRALVYRIGNLGDTLMALPALWAVRQYLTDHRITVLSERNFGGKFVTAREVLNGSGVCDEFLEYPVPSSLRGKLLLPWRMAALILTLRLRRFRTLVYLAPTRRTAWQIARDQRFFQAAGIRNFIGLEGYVDVADLLGGPNAPLPPLEADLLLNRLAASGVPVPAPGQGSMELGLGAEEGAQVSRWLAGLPSDGGRPWISVGPGGNKPVTLWPVERYEAVVSCLIERFDVWPVIFGGPQDRKAGDALTASWGRGHNAAVALGVRPAMAAMKRCKMHLGNDTGTMHMAAAVGLPCVGVYASHEPGFWHPYGASHRILQTRIDCEGCLLAECLERSHKCLLSITVQQVTEACVEVLTRLAANAAWKVLK